MIKSDSSAGEKKEKKKKLFIPCFFKDKLTDKSFPIKSLKPYGTIGIFTTLQYKKLLPKIKKILEKKGKKKIIVGNNGGLVLGCTAERIGKDIETKVDSFLYIGSGKFHPLGIALNTNKPVFIFNPHSSEIKKISTEEKKNL